MIAQYQGTFSTLTAEYPLLAGALTRHTNKRGEPLTFKLNPALVELYTDLPIMGDADIQACVQVGKTEVMMQHMLYRAGWLGDLTAYVMPTSSLRDRFVQNRVDTILREIPAYAARTPKGTPPAPGKKKADGVDNLKSKKFGAGTMMFLSAFTEGDWIEFSTDLMIIDEFDKCSKTQIVKAKDRLSESKRPQLIRMGNPTIPGTGIAECYQQTDQRRFHYRCGHCGTRQPIDWLENMIMLADDGSWVPRDQSRYKDIMGGMDVDIRPVCKGCHQTFDRFEWGHWVALAPDSGIRRGYWMSRLDVLSQSLWEIFIAWLEAQASPEKLWRFWNSLIGGPYEASGTKVTQTDIDRAANQPPCVNSQVPEGLDKRAVVCGVDVGSVLNITLSEMKSNDDDSTQRDGRWMGAVVTFAELRDVVTRFHVDVVVIDAMPETRKAQEFRDWGRENGIRVYLCRFHSQEKTGVEWCGLTVNEVQGTLMVNRTGLLDESLADLRGGRRTLPGDIGLVLGFAKQMKEPTRVLNPRGDRYIWTKTNKPDHYRLADAYERVAAEVYKMGGGTFEIDLSASMNNDGQFATTGRRRRRRR